jgi:hypothetical protein
MMAVPFLIRGVRQQRNVARALDCLGKHSLMYGAVPRNSSRQNLATLRNIVPQEPDILKIDDVYFLDAKATDSPATHTSPATTLRRTAPVEIIIAATAIVTASSIFIIC